MTPDEAMRRIDGEMSHVWVVRTFLKHSEEAEEAEGLYDVVRTLYDSCLALGPAWTAQDADAYLKMTRKKLPKLKAAADDFTRLRPDVSEHTNFKMAEASLHTALGQIGRLLGEAESDE